MTLREEILSNSGQKNHREVINESLDSSKKEMMITKRVLDIVSSFINQVEDLKFDINSPTMNRYYGGPMQTTAPSISPEETVEIKKKAYELFVSKMKLADEVIKGTFGQSKEKDDDDEEGEW